MLEHGCLLRRHGLGLYPTSILRVSLMLLMMLVNTRGQDSFSGNGTYARYPGWSGLSGTDGLLLITFRTSHSDGLILYAEGLKDGDDQNEELEITLVGGQISVNVLQRRDAQPTFESVFEQFYLGQNLNDNKPHMLSIQQLGGTMSIRIVDQPDSEVNSTLLGTPSSIGSTELYFGGVPMSVDSQLSASSSPFIGCLDDVQFANTSTLPESLVSVMPLEQSGVVNGCVDPCTSVSCGQGECVAILPDQFHCDCSSTLMGGANCNEDLSLHRFELTLDSYLCYSLTTYPFIDRTASVRLLSPLPVSGTIMTGISPRGDYFNLYLEESLVRLDFVPSNETRVQLTANQMLDSSASYQIDIQLELKQIHVIISTLSGSVVEEIERLSENTTVSVVSGFTSICIGGTMLELPYYDGIVERAIFNRVSLSNRTFVGSSSVETRADVISLRPNITQPPLRFERLNFANNYFNIMFEMRLEQDELSLAGTPIEISKDGTTLSLFVVSNHFSIIGFRATGFVSADCRLFGQPVIDDNRWHHVNLTLIRNDDGTSNAHLIVDSQISSLCEVTDSVQKQTLDSILASLITSGAPIDFGIPTMDRMSSTTVDFIGCFRNFEFRQTPSDNSPVSPDLALAKKTVQRFGAGDSCYGCLPTDSSDASCQGGLVCADCGFNISAQCLAPSNVCPSADGVPLTMAPTTSSSMTTTTREQIPVTSLGLTTSDNEEVNTTTSAGQPLSSTQIIGIAVGASVGGVLILIILVVVIVLCICLRPGLGKQGFYKTEESNGKVVTMLHYSASLRQIASEQVTMAETNGVSPMHTDGLRPKEFYL